MAKHSEEIASAPKGFHLGACKRSWKAGAPADEGCCSDCPRRLWAENERLRERVDRLEWALLHPTTADAVALRAQLSGSPTQEETR